MGTVSYTHLDVYKRQGTHGSHHARIVRFLKEHGIEAVVVDHMGPGMVQVMATMRIPLLPATAGDARRSILAAIEGCLLYTSRCV